MRAAAAPAADSVLLVLTLEFGEIFEILRRHVTVW